MERYADYKETGIEWIGEIPTNWNLKKLKYLVSQRAETIEEADLNLAVENIESGTGKLINLTTENSYQGTLSKFCKGDTLFNKLRPYLHKVYFAEKEGGLIGELLILYSKGEIEPKFLFYSLFNKSFIDVIDSSTQGTKMPRANWDTFINQLSLSFPDTEDEQTQIANYLDTKTAEIDNIIAAKKKLIELYEEEKAAIINQSVTKGINPDVTLKPSGVEWLGDIPEHWNYAPMKYLGTFINGYSFKSSDFQKQGVRVLKISNIQHMNIDWSDESFVEETFYEEYSNFQVYQNDLVFALTRPIISSGIKVAMIDTDEKILINQRNSVFRSKEIDPKWIYYILLNKKFIQEFDMRIDKTGQQPNISSNDIGEIKIPVTTIEEAKSIVEYLESTIEQMNEKINKAKKLIELLTEYRTTLISEVVTGKIKVTA